MTISYVPAEFVSGVGSAPILNPLVRVFLAVPYALI